MADCWRRLFARGAGSCDSHRLQSVRVAEAAEEANRYVAAVVAGEVSSGGGDSQAGELAPMPDFGKKPLGSAARVPRSFYVRDKSYRAGKIRTVEPRSQGRLQGRKVETFLQWGGWQPYYCTIRESRFLIYELANATGKGYNGEPAAALNLIGAHLSVDHANRDSTTGFRLRAADGVQWALQTETHELLLEWLQFFTGVAGLYRRAEDFFQVGKKLGEGATCRAYEATSRLSRGEFVLKVRVDATNLASTRGMHNELRILQKCAPHRHPAIPHLEDYFFDQDGRIALVMEKFEGGELFDRVMGENHFTEQQARKVFQQLVDGVAFLHSLGIAHRDLKPSNTLIKNKTGDPQIAIVDYDLAKVDYSDVWQASTPCGTTPYMAPEMVKHKRRYGTAVDMWSLGCMLHVLLTGKRAFDGKTDDDIRDAITSQRYKLSEEKLEEMISPLARDLLSKLLVMKPEERLTAAECLQHPWLHAKEDQLPNTPLQTPENVRKHFSLSEIRNLSSDNLVEAAKIRTKLREIVDADHVDPPEGRRFSVDSRSSIDNPNGGAPCSTKREKHIENLKILLEEASLQEDPLAARSLQQCMSPGKSEHGSSGQCDTTQV